MARLGPKTRRLQLLQLEVFEVGERGDPPLPMAAKKVNPDFTFFCFWAGHFFLPVSLFFARWEVPAPARARKNF